MPPHPVGGASPGEAYYHSRHRRRARWRTTLRLRGTPGNVPSEAHPGIQGFIKTCSNPRSGILRSGQSTAPA
eukprot:1196288-Prorocentrum_minimum.AAC.5